jgi:Phosphotransferase enzyme family
VASAATPEQILAERVARRLDQRLRAWRPVSGGYTSAQRLIVTCGDGTSVFVKGAIDTRTATWLRTEYRIYSQIVAPFLPRMLTWEDDGACPFLVLEDLSDAVWHAPWNMARITRVLETLRHVAATAPPVLLPDLGASRSQVSGWAHVEAEPATFLRLGLCSARWLARTIGVLATAEASVRLSGEELVHGDVRSDNLCFVENRVVLVDWNLAGRGNGTLDIAGWLPSLHLEGGPLPDAILVAPPGWAALISGYFAMRAGLPAEQASPRIRELQHAQLRVALPWAVRALGLPPLDGPATRAMRGHD